MSKTHCSLYWVFLYSLLELNINIYYFMSSISLYVLFVLWTEHLLCSFSFLFEVYEIHPCRKRINYSVVFVLLKSKDIKNYIIQQILHPLWGSKVSHEFLINSLFFLNLSNFTILNIHTTNIKKLKKKIN